MRLTQQRNKSVTRRGLMLEKAAPQPAIELASFDAGGLLDGLDGISLDVSFDRLLALVESFAICPTELGGRYRRLRGDIEIQQLGLATHQHASLAGTKVVSHDN